MDKALPDALVTGYEHLVDVIELPDREDRHVLAAAIRCGASVIVTLNLGDFPRQTLANYSIEAQDPDDFVLSLLETFPALVVGAARNHRASLKNPAKTTDEYFAELDAQGLGKTVLALRELVADRSSVI